MFLPNDEEVRAAALKLGLLNDRGLLPPDKRAVAYKAALDARTDDEKPPQSVHTADPTLLSRSVVKVDSGHLVIEVRHIPTA